MTSYHLGLLGFPLEHSFSPRLHQAVLAGFNLSGRYELIPIPPGAGASRELEKLMHRLRKGEFLGINVTIPYKQAIIPYLDELTPTAQAIGAVNAILVRGKKLVGENFDAPAFLEDIYPQLRRAGIGTVPDVPNQTALVLGAGGAARAIVYGLLSKGWQVRVAARRLGQVKEIAETFQEYPGLSAHCLGELTALDLEGVHLVVNTTPVGMFPLTAASAWPEGLSLPAGALVYDLVYNPPVTAFMLQARDQGLPAANGLGMLARQAAFSFAAWTGLAPDWRVMLRSLDSQVVMKRTGMIIEGTDGTGMK